MNKKVIASILGGASLLLVSGAASAIIVGGVDFGTPGTSHLESATLAEQLITADGDTLTGYGQINTVNGNLFYAGANRLYYTFENYTAANFSATSVDFTGGLVNFYLGATFNTLAQSSATNMGIIQAYTPWATFAGSDIGTGFTLSGVGTLLGNNISFNGAGLLNTIGGLADVVSYLSPNNLFGAADMTLTSDGANLVLNPFDVTTGCGDGTAVAGTWCISGSASTQGTTVINAPEPDVAALLGLGLLGFFGLQRKRKVHAHITV